MGLSRFEMTTNNELKLYSSKIFVGGDPAQGQQSSGIVRLAVPLSDYRQSRPAHPAQSNALAKPLAETVVGANQRRLRPA